MKRGLGFMLTVVLAAGLAPGGAASFIEDNTPIVYQNDGGFGQDASDVCSPAQPTLTLNQGGEGQMVAVDDERDTWALATTANDVGKTVVMSLEANHEDRRLATLITFPMTFQVFDPGCSVVLASGAANACKAQGDPATCKQQSSFVVTQAGTYTIQVDLESDDPRFPVIQELLGMAPDTQHCSPFCFWDYVTMPRTVN